MEYRGTSIKEIENRFREYNMIIEPSLFGGYILTCCWGRIGQKKREQPMFFETLEECIKEFNRIKKIRKKHEYTEHQVA